ncbi:hypothetical protein SELMODRAFT_445624 [Selaginella moellendorffii]|uniref:Bifunctional inhibitor/plant lipid transfer protein/seed storage helical domain-containing protein n=1 Tax=Selaginella moellendorffii TaxID=88036 RepID=D8SK12_SELML|nr:uncharacterized protein LOC9643998 [Selaginella moellendorffii]EFJ08374.1 hypothetical protein SELMODRAFT_428962 [Selaginella moellendorffii]EFJ15254.1 hypothetical protein SELMODRAFT_445624 [Selaginella moellendorffii]|eukprot:XP_002983758.1 uncharacterized protein LOC9643998 [Selaginella moellendorffii]
MPKLVLILFFLVAAAAQWRISIAQQQSCSDWTQLLDCQNAASDPSATPSGECCNRIRQYQNAPDCLCTMLLAARNAAQSTGLPFNLQAALSIPAKCHVQVPSGYSCAGIPIPSS